MRSGWIRLDLVGITLRHFGGKIGDAVFAQEGGVLFEILAQGGGAFGSEGASGQAVAILLVPSPGSEGDQGFGPGGLLAQVFPFRFLGGGLFGFPARFLEAHTGHLVVAPAQALEFADDFQHGFAAFGAFFGLGFTQQDEQGEGGDLGGAVGERDVADFLLQFAGFGEEALVDGSGFLVALPFPVAAVFPLAQVLFGDGAATEVFLEDGLDVAVGVEPGDEGGAGLAVGETFVELGAQVLGEPPRFCRRASYPGLRLRGDDGGWRVWRDEVNGVVHANNLPDFLEVTRIIFPACEFPVRRCILSRNVAFSERPCQPRGW